jgi:ATP-dependent Clp protease ATP-binding subunit ClpB
MTSNIGFHQSDRPKRNTSTDPSSPDLETVMESLRTHFRPEFLNRIDEIVVFNSLTIQGLKRIVSIQIGGLNKRLADRKIVLNLTDEATEYLTQAGYDPRYGARPLKRLIKKEIEAPVAIKLLSGEFQDDCQIHVDYRSHSFSFTRQVDVLASSNLRK